MRTRNNLEQKDCGGNAGNPGDCGNGYGPSYAQEIPLEQNSAQTQETIENQTQIQSETQTESQTGGESETQIEDSGAQTQT